MTQAFTTADFTSSAKVLTYYADTPGIRKMMAEYGDRLEVLGAEDKFQLCTAIALYLWGMCEESDEGDEDEFEDVFGLQVEEPEDLLNAVHSHLCPTMTGDVEQCLIMLQNEECSTLAQLLPAIAEYARDDDR